MLRDKCNKICIGPVEEKLENADERKHNSSWFGKQHRKHVNSAQTDL